MSSGDFKSSDPVFNENSNSFAATSATFSPPFSAEKECYVCGNSFIFVLPSIQIFELFLNIDLSDPLMPLSSSVETFID